MNGMMPGVEMYEYAAYVWLAYGAAFLILSAVAFVSFLQLSRTKIKALTIEHPRQQTGA